MILQTVYSLIASVWETLKLLNILQFCFLLFFIVICLYFIWFGNPCIKEFIKKLQLRLFVIIIFQFTIFYYSNFQYCSNDFTKSLYKNMEHVLTNVDTTTLVKVTSVSIATGLAAYACYGTYYYMLNNMDTKLIIPLNIRKYRAAARKLFEYDETMYFYINQLLNLKGVYGNRLQFHPNILRQVRLEYEWLNFVKGKFIQNTFLITVDSKRVTTMKAYDWLLLGEALVSFQKYYNKNNEFLKDTLLRAKYEEPEIYRIALRYCAKDPFMPRHHLTEVKKLIQSSGMFHDTIWDMRKTLPILQMSDIYHDENRFLQTAAISKFLGIEMKDYFDGSSKSKLPQEYLTFPELFSTYQEPFIMRVGILVFYPVFELLSIGLDLTNPIPRDIFIQVANNTLNLVTAPSFVKKLGITATDFSDNFNIEESDYSSYSGSSRESSPSRSSSSSGEDNNIKKLEEVD